MHGAETDVTTRGRTKAEWAREGGLMDVVRERGNLMLAYDRVLKNKGAAGVDGIGGLLARGGCGESNGHEETAESNARVPAPTMVSPFTRWKSVAF